MKDWAITLNRETLYYISSEESVTAEFIKSRLIAGGGFVPEIEVIPAEAPPNKNHFVGFTPEENAWWEKTILDGHKNRHLNKRG